MHIGFDISQTGAGKTGCGFYAHAMIGAMLHAAPAHRYSLYPSFGDFYFDPAMPLMNPYRGAHVRYGPRKLTRESAARFWSRADLEEALGNPDVIHANNFWCPTQLRRARLVYTCYDLGFMHHPEWTTEANRVGCFEGMFRSAVSADWVVAISEATRRDYLGTFPAFPAERVRVIAPSSRFRGDEPGSHAPARAGALESGRFFLSVGTVEPRKNQWLLAQAYARYRELGGPAWPLVFAGGAGWLMDDFESRLAALGVSRDIRITGYVKDDELIWLYRHARANLYPSRFEGFGLPVLEGMQFGAATVTSNVSSLPEVAGEAALLLPPDDVERWAHAMLELARDEARVSQLRAAAAQQARKFDARAGAAALLSLYEEGLAAPKRFDEALA
jgi:glycosyltransferase involved in cell wall biosynthesis